MTSSSWFSRVVRSSDFWLPLAALAGSLWVFAAMADGSPPVATGCEATPAEAAASPCVPRGARGSATR